MASQPTSSAPEPREINTSLFEIDEDDENPAGSSCLPVAQPVVQRGDAFQPLEIEEFEPHINKLPDSPLLLFQAFVPISLVQLWVEYTNEHVEFLQRESKPTFQARLQSWVPTTVAEVYLWLGILIYMGIHKEIRLEDHWKAPTLESHLPTHSIIKFMTFNRFELLLRHIRIFPAHITNNLPSPYNRIEQWSQHIQQVSTAFVELGTCLSVDECMIRFTGRSKATTTVKNKPTPHGFKVWVIAQGGLFLRWIWHKPGPAFGPIGLPNQRKRKRAANTEPHLSLTQRVVIHLVNLLPSAIYHVFFDNLFSSPDLFRVLRKQGSGATGTARSNCGFYKPFVQRKVADKAGSSGLGYNEIMTTATPDNLVRDP